MRLSRALPLLLLLSPACNGQAPCQDLIKGPVAGGLQAAVITSDGKTLALVGQSGYLGFMDLEDLSIRSEHGRLSREAVRASVLSKWSCTRRGDFIAILDDMSDTLDVYPCPAGSPKRSLRLPNCSVQSICLLDNATVLVSSRNSADTSSTVTLWDPLSGESLRQMAVRQNYGRLHLVDDQDGFAGFDSVQRIYIHRNFNSTPALTILTDPYYSLGLMESHVSSHRFAAGECPLTVFDSETLKVVFRDPANSPEFASFLERGFEKYDENEMRNGIVFATFSRTGRYLLTANGKNSIFVWNTSDWSLTRRLEGHSATVLSVAFDGHEERIVSTSQDGDLRVWDGASSRVLATVPLTEAAWIGAYFAAKGDTIIGILEDGRVVGVLERKPDSK